MKYLIIIPDGCADRAVASLGGLTPMQAARLPNLDALAASGIIGTSYNVPESLSPGSDVATLSLLGYDPLKCYTGRAPLEAIAQGIELSERDWAIRCNLVTLADGLMKSFAAGHISSEEAAALLASAQEPLSKIVPDPIRFYPGVSYRNLMVYSQPENAAPYFSGTETFPPHDFSDRAFAPGLPRGRNAEILQSLIDASAEVFADHPVNRSRIEHGKLPATNIWLWGHGQKPQMATFAEMYGVARGAMITAVDLLRGIAELLGWDRIEVPGATGYLDTDYAAKGRYAAEALKDHDVVCIHVEAPDEAGHEGDARKKLESLERIDAELIPEVLPVLRSYNEWRILVSPDHPTPIELKTHSHEPVPWLMAGSDIAPEAAETYDEQAAAESPRKYAEGYRLMEEFIRAE